MQTHIFRPLLPQLGDNQPFSPYYVFDCGKHDRPIIIFPDSNILIETDKILANAHNSQLSAIKNAYLSGAVLCMTQGCAPPQLIILPMILAIEGTKKYHQQYQDNYKKLYAYLGIQEYRYDLGKMFSGLFAHTKSPIGMKDTPMKTYFMDTYFMTLLMIYSIKRYEHAKTVLLPTTRGKRQLPDGLVPDGIHYAVYDQLYWADILDATTLRLIQYYFSPNFSNLPRKSTAGKFKRNFFKKIEHLNNDNWENHKKVVWNIACDIFLLRMPSLLGESAWIMTADEGLAQAQDYLISYQKGEDTYWRLHGDKPPFNTPYWRKTGNFLANVKASHGDKVFTGLHHGSLAPLVPKLEAVMAQFLEDKNLDNFGAVFANSAGGVTSIVIAQ
ncbi:MAG: hypothetical protein CR975_05580 [Gammaproteobacteria bacterium]|nr:MAG: hypothetical protein CR975_05580 [Gammaproteobacteria bacterium]